MKVKSNELVGKALDWGVTTCEGVEYFGPASKYLGTPYFKPSTDWAQGGPIVEREHIELRPGSYIGSKENPRLWAAWCQNRHGDRHQIGNTGPTPLIAAMRCYVASKMGNVVDIPEELCAKS